MRRRAAKVDDNQSAIVDALRRCGATVVPLHTAGDGFPDLVVGFRGRNLLIEVKDGSKPPSKRKLTPGQIEFHAVWRGQIAVVSNEAEALALIDVQDNWKSIGSLAADMVRGSIG